MLAQRCIFPLSNCCSPSLLNAAFIAIQESVWECTSLHPVTFSLCKYGVLPDPMWAIIALGVNFAIFQCYHHCFQCTEDYTQIQTWFPGRNLQFVQINWLRRSSFCVLMAVHWSSGIQFVFHIAVTIAETLH